MLPHINGEQWLQSLRNRRILVGGGGDEQFSGGILAEPSPSAAEDAHSCSIHLFLKTFKELGIKEGYVGSPARADSDYGRWFFQETVNLYARSTVDLYEGKTLPSLPVKIKIAMRSPFGL